MRCFHVLLTLEGEDKRIILPSRCSSLTSLSLSTRSVSAVVNHPWISGIAGTLIAAVLAKWFGLA